MPGTLGNIRIGLEEQCKYFTLVIFFHELIPNLLYFPYSIIAGIKKMGLMSEPEVVLAKSQRINVPISPKTESVELRLKLD